MERVIEALILLVAVVPVARVCCARPFLLKLRAIPNLAARLIATFIVYLLIVGAAMIYSPMALRILAGGALLAIAFFLWRARPGYRRARGLPPGSLMPAPIGPWIDDRDYLKRAARYGPVFKVSSELFQPMVCIVGLKSGAELLRNHDADLRVPALPFNRYMPKGLSGTWKPTTIACTRRSFGRPFRTRSSASTNRRWRASAPAHWSAWRKTAAPRACRPGRTSTGWCSRSSQTCSSASITKASSFKH
jgi:hypothetical protein